MRLSESVYTFYKNRVHGENLIKAIIRFYRLFSKIKSISRVSMRVHGGLRVFQSYRNDILSPFQIRADFSKL